MINKVSIRNFKCLQDVQLDLERFTVFVGPNASGKSSILQALDLLCRSFHRLEGPGEQELVRAKSQDSTNSIELAGRSGELWYRFRPVGLVSHWELNGTDSVALPRSVLLRLEVPKLIDPKPLPGDETAMAPDGTGLHSALAHLAESDPDSWRRIQEGLRKIIPTIGGVRHAKTSVDQHAVLVFDTVSAESLTADQVSESTLLTLGMLAALHSAASPKLILLDDLERGLHPIAQRDLVGLLRNILETNSALQIVATTHSPYLLDRVEPNEVRMTNLVNGYTVCGPLSAHPKFAKWKDEMWPGRCGACSARNGSLR